MNIAEYTNIIFDTSSNKLLSITIEKLPVKSAEVKYIVKSSESGISSKETFGCKNEYSFSFRNIVSDIRAFLYAF